MGELSLSHLFSGRIISLISTFLFLTSLQRPLWCARHSEVSCNDRGYYFLGQLLYLTSTESLIFEVCRTILLPLSFEFSYQNAFVLPSSTRFCLDNVIDAHFSCPRGLYVSDSPYFSRV